MEAARPFSERTKWIITRSCGCEYNTLLVDGRDEAAVMTCPAGWAMRMHRLPFDRPGAHEVFPTRDEAIKAAENWFTALDIVPWD